MGWRTQDAYDRAERERVRALPLGERYNWPNLFALGIVLAGGMALWWWLG